MLKTIESPGALAAAFFSILIVPAALLSAARDQNSPAAPDFKDRVALFSYDRAAPLDVREIKAEKRGETIVKDIDFAPVPGAPRVKAFILIPSGEGPFAGILWVHWLGEKLSNREEFLEEALALAPRGAVSLLVDAMWADPNWYGTRDPDEDYPASIRQVVELRRALDLLVGQRGVDPLRPGVVGHDYGGMYATYLAGVDQRPKTDVLAAVTPSLLDWAFFLKQPKSKVDYIRRMAELDITDFLRRAKGASFFLQFAKNDNYVSRAGSAVYFAAAPGVKERKYYDADHALAVPAVASDRSAWLVRELGLRK